MGNVSNKSLVSLVKKKERCPACHKTLPQSLPACPHCKKFKFCLEAPEVYNSIPPDRLSDLTCRVTWLYLFLRDSALNVFNELMGSFKEDIHTLTEKHIPLPDFELSNAEKLGLLRAFHLMSLAKTRENVEKKMGNPTEVTYVNTALLELYKPDTHLFMENGPGLCEGIKTSPNPDMFWSHTMTGMLQPHHYGSMEVRMGMACFFGPYIEDAEILAEMCLERAFQEDKTTVEDALTRYELDIS